MFLAERWPVVKLDELNRSAQAAVLARARGFVGCFGVEACLGLLLGRPVVVVLDEGVDRDELRMASLLLARRPFGRLHVLEAVEGAVEASEEALRFVEDPVETLAAV